MKTHFSLDIETLDTKTSAVVLSIGICAFNASNIDAGEHFSLQIEPQLAAGRTISDDTFAWWVSQLVEMNVSPFPEDRGSWDAVRDLLYDYLERQCYTNILTTTHGYGPGDNDELINDTAIVWVRGPHFDWSILESLFADNPLPVKYSHVRDQRTFCDGSEYEGPLDAHAHNALSDATRQAIFIQQVARARDIEL